MLPMSRVVRMRRRAVLIVMGPVLAGLALCAGCGGKKEEGGVLLATVGDSEIRKDYYEDRLSRLEEKELPQDEQGHTLDMATMAGKQAFLTTLINKELMVKKATQLGYASEPRVEAARQSLIAYEAGMAMWRHVVGAPSDTLSPDEVDAFYAKLGQQRKIEYLITNFEKDAQAALTALRAGEDWDDVAARYHDGATPETGGLTMTIPFGRFDADFERPIFDAEVGELVGPVRTDYGYWVLRVLGIKEIEKPALEDAKARILDLTYQRKVARLRNAFREKVHERYKLRVEDEALLKAYEGLPEGELIIDPATNEPVPREELQPLDVDPADLDLPFYSYEIDAEPRAFTLGDYKIKFDKMNTFQRPKKSSMMGGMRTHIIQELERSLMDAEAKRLGFYEDPEALANVEVKIEEMMVTSLYNEVVASDDRITPEQMDAYWAAHADEFAVPESRNGRLVIAADEAAAIAAREEILKGVPWKDVVTKYGTDENNRSRSGKLENISARSSGPVRDALFSQPQGEIGAPFPAGDGRYAVLKVETVTPGHPAELNDVRETVGQRMRQERKEEAFQALLAKWTEEFGVIRYDENLAEVKSWKELTHVELPGPPVPRS